MSSPVSSSPLKPAVYRFGQFELRTGAGELVRNRHAQRLPDQPLQILLTLLERPGEIVSRELLRERLWPENTFVDFELGLNAAMKRLRRSLHDDAANPTFIETLPKRGYRLLAPVTVEKDLLDQDEPAEASKSAETPQAKPVAWRWTTWALVASTIFAIAGLVVGWKGVRR